MSFSVGIVGLPNVGKSTLFKVLTKKRVDIATYPFTTIDPNVGIVTVPDERLEKIAEIIKPEKITPTIIEFVDIAGLVKDAYRGVGLGNQFLAQIRNCDAIIEVIRAFENRGVENILGEINPEKEAEIIKTELLMKDLETLEGLIQKVTKDFGDDKKTKNKFELLKRIKDNVVEGKLISEIGLTNEENLEIKEFQFLTTKPIIYVINGENPSLKSLIDPKFSLININFKLEEEIAELNQKDKKELNIESQINRLILNCYAVLNLITFFTVVGGKELRAWTIEKGSLCPRAGGRVHSDFEKKFIRAEVISWEKLIEVGSWIKAKEKGWIKAVGKDYPVRDGDVIEFKI